MRLILVVLSLCLLGLVAAQTLVNCPIDCSVDGDIQGQLDACILSVEECDDITRAVPRVEWVAVFGTTDIDNTTTSLTIVPINQTATRIDCLANFNLNDTNNNGDLILVCVEYEFCYTPIDTVLDVPLSGNCFASAFSFPGVEEINFVGPANVLGAGLFIDQLVEPNINFDNIAFFGGGTTDQLFADPVTNANITMTNVQFQGFLGDHVIALEACDFFVTWVFDNITIFNGQFQPLYFEGMDGLTVKDYTCSQCVTLDNGECLHVNPSPYAFGELIIQRVNCFRLADRLPPRCRYCLDNGCYSRCNNGEVQTFDRINTEIFANCPIVSNSFFEEESMTMLFNIQEFDPECRIYRKPSCNFISAVSADNFTQIFNFAGGDIIWDYGRDLICGPGGDIVPSPSGGYILAGFENVLGDPVPVNELPPLPPPISFFDRSVEALGTAWQQQATLNSDKAPIWDERGYGPAITNTSDPNESDREFARGDPRTGTYFFSCKAQERRSVRQVLQVTPAEAGVQQFRFWAAVSNDDAKKLFDRFIRLLIDGIEVDRFPGPEIEATFVNDETYYLFTFEPYNLTVGERIITLECDFTPQPDDGVNMWVAIDDVSFNGPANNILLDKSFEYHSLTWQESSQGLVIKPAYFFYFFGLIPINQNQGVSKMWCQDGADRWIQQTVEVQNDGVYVLSFYATRGTGTSANEAAQISISATVFNPDSLAVDAVTFDSEDLKDTPQFFGASRIFSENSFIVDNAPANITVRFRCDGTAATDEIFLYLDFFETATVGVPNVIVSTLGFSSQTISSAPRIVNDTCDCSNFAAPERDPALLPCLYALNDTDTICEEEIPFCCVEEEVAISPLFGTVFYEVCSDLGNSSCVFLTDCEFNFVTDEIFNCSQYVCPDNYLVQNGFAYLNMTEVVLMVGDATVTVDQDPVLSITIDLLGTVQTVNDTVANLLVDGVIVDVVVNSTGIYVQVQTPVPIPLQTTVDGDLESLCTLQVLSFFNGTILGSATENVTYQANNTYIYTELNMGWTCPATSLEPEFFYSLCTDFNTDDCIIFTDCDSILLGQGGGLVNEFLGCTRLNCTAPDNEPPMFQADFLSCSPYNNNGTILDNETYVLADGNGGAFIFVDGLVEVIEFDDYQLFLEIGNECFWVINRPSLSPLISECQDFPFFRICPCTENGTYTVPMLADDAAPGGNLSDIPIGGGNPEEVLDFFYFCTDRVASCRCNEAAIIASNPPPNGTVGIHIVRIPETMSRVSMVDNRVVDYEYGWIQEQTTFAKITSNTIAIPDYDDNRGLIREIAKNDNEFITGGTWDFVLNEVGSPYQETCNCEDISPYACCPQFFTREEDFDCLVDDRANEELPGFGSTIFNTITDALNDCKGRTIVIRSNVASGYFEENIEITNNQKNFYIASTVLNPAIIVGSHRIDTDAKNITLRGIEFVHSAENNKPLFDIRKDDNSDLREMTILNCILDGSGCRKCGIFDTKRLSFLVINYTSIVDWSFFALKLDDIDQLVMSGNVVDECEGRCFLIKFKGGYWIERMSLVRVRGGEDLKGAALISLTAKDDDLCDPNDPDPVRRCLLRDIIQHVNVTDPDYRDIGIYMAKGSIVPQNFYDIWIRKARNGFVGLKLNNVNAANLRTDVMMLNPGIRPSLFQDRVSRANRRNVGTDYVLRGVAESAIFDGLGFEFTNNVETDFDANPGFVVPINPIVCESNPNWALETGLGPGLTYPRMGLNIFANASLMVEYCEDRRRITSFNPDLDFDDDTMSADTPAFIGYVRSFNGTRLVPENITFFRSGWLIGDDRGARCKSPNFRPGIVGLGQKVLAYNWNITNLEFFMPNLALPRLPLWSSGLLDYPDDTLSGVSEQVEIIVPENIIVDNCVFSGRGILPLEQAYALDFFIGRVFEESILKAEDNELPPFTNARVIIRDSFFQDWAAFTLEDQGGFEFVNEEFPFTGGGRFQYRNRLNSDTIFNMTNTTMREMDYAGLQVFHANYQSVNDSSFYNCSGRAFGNFACVFMVGNNVYDILEPSRIRNNTLVYLDTPIETYFDRNTHLNTWDLLYRRDDRLGQPSYVSAYHFDGHPNSSLAFCIRNSTAFGLTNGLRLENVENQTFINCPTFNPAVFFPDRARYLRTLCIEGGLELLSGFNHWLTDGPGSTDAFWEGRYCDNACCFLVPPEECFVTTTPDLLSPDNPWFGDGDGVDDYVFASINDCIVECSAERRVCNIIGREDPFEFDFSNKEYIEVISATVPLVSVSGVDGPMRIIGYGGSTVIGIGHSVVTNGVQTTFETVRFEHTGGTSAIWEQTTTASDADGLRFIGCIFRGEGVVNELSIDILIGDPFEIRSCIFEGDGAQINAVRIATPGDCLQYPEIHKNVLNDILGAAIELTGSPGRINGNEFDNVGGQDLITSTPYAVYFAPNCPEDPSRKNQFKRNELVTMQTAVATVGRMAAFWLDFNGVDDGYMRVQENSAEGMEIGIRFENMLDDSPSDDRKLQLRFFALTEGNIRAQGTWHDLVRGSPADDIDIDTDPSDPANVGRFCDNGCPNNRLIIAILLATLFGLLILCCLCLCCCLLTRRSSASLYSSSYLEQDVPTSVFKRMGWSPNDHNVDPSTLRTTPASVYQNPYQTEQQFYKQTASQERPPNMLGASRSGGRRRRATERGTERERRPLLDAAQDDQNDLEV